MSQTLTHKHTQQIVVTSPRPSHRGNSPISFYNKTGFTINDSKRNWVLNITSNKKLKG